jgi:hypothetical protein
MGISGRSKVDEAVYDDDDPGPSWVLRLAYIYCMYYTIQKQISV